VALDLPSRRLARAALTVEHLPDDLARAYLDLLECDLRPGGVDAGALCALQVAHVARVPYETLDIVRGRAPGIDPVESVKRVVAGRGGYCYHLNGAFSALLSWLEVDVMRHVAGVQGRGQERPGANANHLGLTARTPDGREWLVDVGLGDGPGEPLPLVAGEHEQVGFRYRLAQPDGAGSAWRFDHDTRGSFEGFDVAIEPAGMGEFAAMHAFLSTESGFARTITAQRRVEGRIEVLRGCVYTETTLDTSTVTQVTEPDAWWDLVVTHFGLSYDDVPADQRETLWRRTLEAHRVWQAQREA
jgi:arylamine N-acetyltransferase